MFEGIVRFLLDANINVSEDEISQQNRRAIHYLAIGGLPVSIVNAMAQSVIDGTPLLGLRGAWLLVYYLVLLVLDQYVIPKNCSKSTLLVYLLEAPIMVVAMLLGTIWDPSHQAVTFLMFTIAMPVFILDRPIRVMCTMLGYNILFVLLSLMVKEPGIFWLDFLHALEFFLLSLLVCSVVLTLRFEVITGLERAQHHLRHDMLTGLQNRIGFEANASSYVGKPLFVVMGDVDHFTLLNDFYGKDSGDLIFTTFAQQLKDAFGTKNTYRYGGDDLMCVAANINEAAGLQLIETTRERLRGIHGDKFHAPLTYSFGYTTGKPANNDELHDMVQLATIYAHSAKRRGIDKTIGGAFSKENLMAGIVDSNVNNNARAYEINQLTDLPTLPYFVVRCEELLGNIINLDRSPVIGYVNIVGFRDFNDVFGYAQGDNLIRFLADLLKQELPNRHIAYITGSQFAIMCYREEVKACMRHVCESIQEYEPDRPIFVHAGFAEYHEGDSVISLIDKAKLAYGNVDVNRGMCYRYYDTALDQEIRFRKYLISHIDSAIDRGWLKVHYQPIVSATDGKICNLEALSRWNDPVYGLLPPSQFISTLESEHIIYKLTLNVVKQVLRDLRRVADLNLPLVPVSINLSRNDFSECDMVDEITKLVDTAGMPHNIICIEITESAFVEKQELLKHEVDRFRSRGFAVWMDDFGSEYSTLNLLQELNFDLIKIDMQFMRGFTPNGQNAIIVAHIIDMCNQLGLTTLVEGVEEQEQFDILREMGSDKLQGYLFSPPRPLTDIIGLAQSKSWGSTLA